MGVRVNWKQGDVASDGLVRVHIIEKQTPKCQFDKMEDYSDFHNEEEAKQEIRQRGYLKYKRCEHCWDGATIEIE